MSDSYEQLKAHFDRIAEKNREDHASLRKRLEQAEQQRDAARAALMEIRVEAAMGAYTSDGTTGGGLTAIGCLDIVSACDAALQSVPPAEKENDQSMTEIDNIRELLGGFIGQRIVEITQHDEGESHCLYLHMEDGRTLQIPIEDGGFNILSAEVPNA